MAGVVVHVVARVWWFDSGGAAASVAALAANLSLSSIQNAGFDKHPFMN